VFQKSWLERTVYTDNIQISSQLRYPFFFSGPAIPENSVEFGPLWEVIVSFILLNHVSKVHLLPSPLEVISQLKQRSKKRSNAATGVWDQAGTAKSNVGKVE
jgi:hypothetical protein